MTNKALNFKTVSRQNTGSSLCDSGSIYGYNYNRKIPNKPVRLEGDIEMNEISGSISLSHFLDQHFEIDQKLTKKLRKAIDQGKCNYNYKAYADFIADLVGGVVEGSDNAYNHDNNLDQVFQFSTIEDEANHETYVVIETHNGCDVRGGYSDPVVCRPLGDRYSFYDICLGVSFLEGKDQAGNEIEIEDLQRLDETYQVGYTSAPLYDFNKAIKRVLVIDANSNTFTVELKTGEIVSGYLYFNGSNGNSIS